MAGMAPPPQQPMFDVRGSNNQRASMVSMGSASQYMFAPPVTSAGVVAVGGGGSVVGYSMPPPATPTRPPNMISSPTSPQHQYQQQQQQPLQPSDNELFAAVKQFLSSANLMSVTKKQVREELSRMFGGVDLTPRKATLNAYIDEILAGKA